MKLLLEDRINFGWKIETNIIQDYLYKNVIFLVGKMCANGKNQINTNQIQHNVRLGAYYIAKWHIFEMNIIQKVFNNLLNWIFA